MRHVVLKDMKISTADFETWKLEDIGFWEKFLGITPTYEVLETTYGDYPTYIDEDGDIRPTQAYLQAHTNTVVKKFGEFGCDFIMLMIHEDNWKSDTDFIKGIWGTNYSYKFGKQCLEYCRWDRDNGANTFGTAYHERHHSFDALVKVETGVDVQPLLGVTQYDHHITHGNQKPWKYIRYRENLDSLTVMKPHLVKAFEVRKKKHEEVLGMMGQIISLATQVIYLLKMRLNQKDGVKRQ